MTTDSRERAELRSDSGVGTAGGRKCGGREWGSRGEGGEAAVCGHASEDSTPPAGWEAEALCFLMATFPRLSGP